ncbi:MAG: hypothetical protein M1510_07700 [Nitrospirae bacterium]|nr:hypothetical protein [Nitrospirota bacterium]MCL5237020.1 hypothetical protein [Nitrospirota bacterium]
MPVKDTTAIMKRLSRATMKSDRSPDDTATGSVRKGFSLPHLSMSISHAFGIAIEEGATLVQVDDILFIG